MTLTIAIAADSPESLVSFIDAVSSDGEMLSDHSLLVADGSRGGQLVATMGPALGDSGTVVRVASPLDREDVILTAAGAAETDQILVCLATTTFAPGEFAALVGAAAAGSVPPEAPEGVLAMGAVEDLCPAAFADRPGNRPTHRLIAPSPIFVVGSPRSGTSMMGHAIRRHPDMWGGPESDHLSFLLASLQRVDNEVYEPSTARGQLQWLPNQGVSSREFKRYLGLGMSALYSSRSRGRRWVEQTPQYTLWLDDIATMFPRANFVFLVRDPRDVVHSLMNFVNPMDLGEACRTWRMYTESGLAFSRSERGHRLIEVRHADVVVDPTAVFGGVLDFCGLPPDDAPAAFASGPRINSSFDGSEERVAGWRSWTHKDRAACNALVGDLVVDLGFEPDESWADQR